MIRNNGYKVLSLFSGGGFLDLGFMLQNFHIQEAVEIEPWFIKGYVNGISSMVRSGRLDEVHLPATMLPLDLSDENVRNDLAERNQGVDGIIGGPPCQDFSVGGKNRGVTGDRGKLIFSYLDLVQKIMPKFIFFENVPGLLSTKVHKEGFDKLIKKLRKDFVISYRILNVLEYGYAQDRPRVTLVGFRKKLFTKEQLKLFPSEYGPELDYKGDNLFNWPIKKFDNPKKEHFWPKSWHFKSSINYSEVEQIPEEYSCLFVKNAIAGVSGLANQNEAFKPYSDKFNTVEEGATAKKSFKRLHRYRYSPTVAYGNNEVHLHPTKPRRLTVREALRLQTVPDEYILPRKMPLTYKFKLIGNGVPTAKAELLASQIFQTLDIL
jgi:DNA (cytosine-5)-methyltransferase 1